MNQVRSAWLSLALLSLAACTTPAPRGGAPAALPANAEANAAAAFFARLSALCGQAFPGRLAVFDESDTQAFAGAIVMHVRECSADTVRIPLHVGQDRSRTWVVTLRGERLRLKHDHRHADGSEESAVKYGGDTVAPGEASRQEFPVDAESRALFESEGRLVSMQNTWAMDLVPGTRFAYELRRPNRHFRIEFDLSRPLPPPPPPWGATPPP